MWDLNKVMLIWRITNDLEIKKIWQNWTSVVNFTIATNRVYKNASWEKIEEPEFHRCVAFWSIADVIWQYLSKGRKIYVEWRLRTRQWEDQSWVRRYTTEIIVTDMVFCDSKWSWKNNNGVSTAEQTVEDTEDEIPF
jgi:single-strand DNA-binding protein